jgi:HK97 family phage prohead protease
MNRPQGFEREQGPDGVETRALARTPATRAAGDDGGPVIEGYGAVTGVSTTIEGWFSDWDEEIARGAFAQALDGDVRSMFNHDTNWLLGRTVAESLRLSEDDTGLFYETDVNPDDAQAMSVHARVKRGDVSGSSIWFRVAEENWEYPSDDNDLERAKRTILRVSPLFEVGPVVFPAFETTTSSARSFARRARSPLAPPPREKRDAGPPRHSTERYRRQAAATSLAARMAGHPL